MLIDIDAIFRNVSKELAIDEREFSHIKQAEEKLREAVRQQMTEIAHVLEQACGGGIRIDRTGLERSSPGFCILVKQPAREESSFFSFASVETQLPKFTMPKTGTVENLEVAQAKFSVIIYGTGESLSLWEMAWDPKKTWHTMSFSEMRLPETSVQGAVEAVAFALARKGIKPKPKQDSLPMPQPAG